MFGKFCWHLDHLSLSSTKLDMQSATKLEIASSSYTQCFSSLSHLFLKSNTFRSPQVCLYPFFLFPFFCFQVLSEFLICTQSLTNLTIFHKLTNIHQNRTPAQVIQFDFLQTKLRTIVYPGITHRRKLCQSSEDELPGPPLHLATHHNWSSDGSPPTHWEKSLPYCCHLSKVAQDWQPPEVYIVLSVLTVDLGTTRLSLIMQVADTRPWCGFGKAEDRIWMDKDKSDGTAINFFIYVTNFWMK